MLSTPKSNEDAYLLDFGSVITSSTQSRPLKSWFVFVHRVAGKPRRPSDASCLASLLLLVLGQEGFAGNTCVELSTLPRGARVGLEWLWDDDEEPEDEVEEDELLRVLAASAIVDKIMLSTSVRDFWMGSVLSVFRSDPVVRFDGEEKEDDESGRKRRRPVDFWLSHTPWALRKSVVYIADIERRFIGRCKQIENWALTGAGISTDWPKG
jgi:hypothetical protein